MVIFNKENHTYKNPETGRYYKSVSKLLGEYRKPFNADFHAINTALKRKTTVEAIKKEWEDGKNIACAKGQDIHDAVEQYIKEEKILPGKESLIENFKTIFPDIHEFKKVHSERIVWDDDNEIAGTSDLICDVRNNYFDVYDFKTNKAFNFYNKYSEYLLSPLDHLQHCHYNDYTLQLSLYIYMYEKQTGRKFRQAGILYHDNTKFNYYPVSYLFWDIQVLLKHHKKNGQFSKTS